LPALLATLSVNINKLIFQDKATSEKLPGEDLELNLDIADKIRSKEFPAKEAVKHLKKKINDKNPVVQLLAIKVTQTY
jgi:growth factor-regulated tyrosine kinase substrate